MTVDPPPIVQVQAEGEDIEWVVFDPLEPPSDWLTPSIPNSWIAGRHLVFFHPSRSLGINSRLFLRLTLVSSEGEREIPASKGRPCAVGSVIQVGRAALVMGTLVPLVVTFQHG